MADSDFAAVAGFVQFDVQENNANGKTVRNVTIRNVGSQKLIRIALWAENWAHVPAINRGDFIVAEGKTSVQQGTKGGEPVTYYNLNAFLIRVEGVTYRRTEAGQRPANQSSTSSASAEDAPF